MQLSLIEPAPKARVLPPVGPLLLQKSLQLHFDQRQDKGAEALSVTGRADDAKAERIFHHEAQAGTYVEVGVFELREYDVRRIPPQLWAGSQVHEVVGHIVGSDEDQQLARRSLCGRCVVGARPHRRRRPRIEHGDILRPLSRRGLLLRRVRIFSAALVDRAHRHALGVEQQVARRAALGGGAPAIRLELPRCGAMGQDPQREEWKSREDL